MKKITVLSLFDGMSCGRIALEKLGYTNITYYASEIDKYAMQVSSHNYPDIIHIGDVSKVSYHDGILYTENGDYEVDNIDIIMGGSPCQGFSFSGKGLNFDDPRSKLFFELHRLIQEINPKYFLVENVVMTKENESVFNEYLDVEPIQFNSSLISAQNRRRLYWTNIPNVGELKDKKLSFSDVMEHGAKNVYYVTPKMWNWIGRNPKRMGKFKIYDKNSLDKMQMLEASHHKGISNQRCFAIRDKNKLRYISPLECERLQTVPDHYTLVLNEDGKQLVSNSQRYKMLGNGWTVDIITHILKNMKI